MKMWPNFNISMQHIVCNNVDEGPKSEISIGKQTNMDCLMHVLSHLSVREKVKCRSVCKSWKEAVDKLFVGQNKLSITVCRKRKFESKQRDIENASNTTIVYNRRLKFHVFHQMLSNFPALQTLSIENLPLSDVFMLVICTSCKYLSSISLNSCIASIANGDDHNNNPNSNDNYSGNRLTSYGWQLLIYSYPQLKHLKIKNCALTDANCEKIITGLPVLKSLDISDNDLITGECLRFLGEHCVTLSAGSLNNDVWLISLLNAVTQSNARLKHLELRGGINQQMTPLKKLCALESLTLKFFCPQDQTIDTLSPISKLTSLRQLCLHQERCYDESSAIDVESFDAIVSECQFLNKLSITGEYGWRLRLTDKAIKTLVNKCPLLEHFALTGNSVDITDVSVHHLVLLPRLRSVSLTSFERITDEGLIHLILRHQALDYIGIKETSSISNATLNACIQVAKSDPNRRLSIFFAETKISKPKSAVLPQNLKVVFEENLRPRRQSDEPSAMKMIAVVGMSAIILAMILITMLVVIVMPVGMLLMMLYDNCVEYAINSADFPLDKDNPLDIFMFYAVQSFRYLISIDFSNIA